MKPSFLPRRACWTDGAAVRRTEIGRRHARYRRNCAFVASMADCERAMTSANEAVAKALVQKHRTEMA